MEGEGVKTRVQVVVICFTRLANGGWSTIIRTVFAVTQIPYNGMDMCQWLGWLSSIRQWQRRGRWVVVVVGHWTALCNCHLGFFVTKMSIREESWSESFNVGNSVNHCQLPGFTLVKPTLSADTTSLGGGGQRTNDLKGLQCWRFPTSFWLLLPLLVHFWQTKRSKGALLSWKITNRRAPTTAFHLNEKYLHDLEIWRHKLSSRD